MNYNKTLNLPKTKFSMKANLPTREPNFQKFWEDNEIYEKILKKNRDGKSFILHDGPPYANGNIHMGHALNRTLKDITIRFMSMKGYYTPFIPGWDCHGLPIEYEVIKKSGGRVTEDKLKFRKKATAYARKFIEIQKKEFQRLGLLGDWDNPYLTLDPEYEAKNVEVFSELYLKKMIFRELKPVLWCPSCCTALAEAEIEYADTETESVFVKFRLLETAPGLKDSEEYEIYALAWTTTPWTLPSNTALCFHPDFSYSYIQKNKEVLIVASEFIEGYEGYREIARVKGSEMEGLKFTAPFGGRESQGIKGDFVTLEDGTGIVHIAPGHGEEDYIVGKTYSLEILSPVDEKGSFTSELGLAELEGKNVFESDPLIIQMLRDKNLIFAEHRISHSYPHCWRCKSPVIFRSTEQWFLGIDKENLRENAIKEISQVSWHPESAENRIRAMVENRPDWCLSRQRLWGVPVPVFHCNSCGDFIANEESFAKIQELILNEGSDGWFRREALDILGSDFKCSCGSSDIRKDDNIIDVWFDSGVSSFAVLESREELSWPADMYLEGTDQHRGWFQTSLIPAVGLRGKAPYKSVLTHGFIVDSEGKKMSKSIGNVISPQEVIQKYGADLLRLWIASENYFRDVKISEEILSQIVTYYRRIRNSIRFILGNTRDLPKDYITPYEEMTPLDKYILHKFSTTVRDIMDGYESYLFHRGSRALHDFCNIWLSSFYFNILKDRLYVSAADDKARRSSQSALRLMGIELLKLASPILPHTSEEAWQVLKTEQGLELSESVFTSDGFNIPEEWNNPSIEEEFEPLIKIRELALKKIEESKDAGLFKDPLESSIKLKLSSSELFNYLSSKEKELKEYLVVSGLEIISDESASEAEILDSGVEIEAVMASGEKCARCWLITPTDELSTEYTDICLRCASVVKEIAASEK